ncbi:TlpA family protein disulfide reductase [Streptococcus ruminantium]|uniref:TlpA family protein disulfide reductase n=1 Tax=Streptococcus ruminantium TaxID=1917441 RepID=UPI0012DC33A6|nr:TlpA disulfide reductase family protein [Streptococcus ruminantium]
MKKREIFTISVIAILVVSAAIYLGMTANLTQSSPAKTEVSQSSSQPSDSELRSLTEAINKSKFLDANDKEMTLANFADKPSIVVFWASWCPDCQAQLPILAKLYEKYGKDINFVFLNVVDGTRETKVNGQKYLTEKYPFTYYQDKGMSVADSMGVKNIPTMFILNKKKEIVTAFRGNRTEEVLATALEAVK